MLNQHDQQWLQIIAQQLEREDPQLARKLQSGNPDARACDGQRPETYAAADGGTDPRNAPLADETTPRAYVAWLFALVGGAAAVILVVGIANAAWGAVLLALPVLVGLLVMGARTMWARRAKRPYSRKWHQGP